MNLATRKSPLASGSPPAGRGPLKWAVHRRALLGLRRRLLHDHLEQMRASFRLATDESGRAVSGSAGEEDFTLALLAREHDALREVNDALDRIAGGAYGVCEVTGLPIPAARLRAVPWTRQVREVAQRCDDIRQPGH